MNNTKQQLLDRIESSVDIFHKISPIQYRMRCPICGDSQKKLKDTHLYIKASYDPLEPVLYKCFLCNAGGRVNESFLNKLGIDSKDFKDLDSQIYNKISTIKKGSIDLLTGYPEMDSKQVGYIQKRLGVGLEYNDYDRFKIVWDINTILPYITDVRIRNTLPNNNESISFISEDKSILLTRFFNDIYGWKKTNIFPSNNRSFYTIKSTLDLFTQDPITVNIAEGILDIISVYKNFNDGNNSIYIAALGSDYEATVIHSIASGFIGDNVIVKLYIDTNINEKHLKNQLKRYKWLFNRILIYKNILYEDFGTSIDKIKAIEYQV